MDGRPHPITVEYAGFWIRLAAYLVDAILVAVIAYVVIRILGIFVDSSGDGPIVPVAIAPGTARVAATAINYSLSFVYLVGFWTWLGRTPGKMMLGLKVVRTNGSRVGLGKSILRYIGYNISYLAFFIGYLWIGVDPEKQGIHDKIADTYVVKLPRKRPKLVQIYG